MRTLRRGAPEVSIARAFLKDAPIILLDEATASLDVDNETLIQSSLSKVDPQQDGTHHCPPHENGGERRPDRGVERWTDCRHGSPKELMEQNGIFAAMSRLQTEGQKWTMA